MLRFEMPFDKEYKGMALAYASSVLGISFSNNYISRPVKGLYLQIFKQNWHL